jgi:hypothetical protein
MKRIQQTFAVLCFTRSFPHIPYNYACVLELLKFYTLQVERLSFDVFIRVFARSKFCRPLIENISLRVPF